MERELTLIKSHIITSPAVSIVKTRRLSLSKMCLISPFCPCMVSSGCDCIAVAGTTSGSTNAVEAFLVAVLTIDIDRSVIPRDGDGGKFAVFEMRSTEAMGIRGLVIPFGAALCDADSVLDRPCAPPMR